MNKIIALLMTVSLCLSACGLPVKTKKDGNHAVKDEIPKEEKIVLKPVVITDDFSDEENIENIEYRIYENVVKELDSDKYYVDDISIKYLSQEYVEELKFNSKENIYFGYTLKELGNRFEGEKYVFTVGENGNTIVRAFEKYDDTYEKAVQNVAIGSGVVLASVTIALVAQPLAPAVTEVLLVGAKTGTGMALTGGGFSAAVAGIAGAVENQDKDEIRKAVALEGSKGIKWGAITGVLTGGAAELNSLKVASKSGLKMNDVARIQQESKYPVEVIKNMRNMDEYQIYKTANLHPIQVNGKKALINEKLIDFNKVDDLGRNSLERMSEGLAPFSTEGGVLELHHVGQKTESALATLPKKFHTGSGNHTILHDLSKTEVDHGSTWNKTRAEFWEAVAKMLKEGK